MIRMRRTLTLLTALLMCLSLSAQFAGPSKPASEGANMPVNITTDRAILFPAPRDIRLQPGDTVELRIYGAEDYHPIDKVSLDGYLRLPLIGPVQVQGLSPHEAERLIAARLSAAGMYNDPQVILTISDSPNQVATVIGEAHGVVPMLVPKRLFDVLAVAGGLPPTASHVVTIQRVGATAPIVVDLGNDPEKSDMANVPIFSGDTIVVGRVGSVYLIGAVKTQSAVPMAQATPLTLMQAVALAGGIPYEAKRDETRIIRTQGTQRIMIPVKLKRVMDGQDPDPVLQSDDIVVVPTSALLAAIRAGGIGTAIGIISIVLTTTLYR